MCFIYLTLWYWVKLCCPVFLTLWGNLRVVNKLFNSSYVKMLSIPNLSVGKRDGNYKFIFLI